MLESNLTIEQLAEILNTNVTNIYRIGVCLKPTGTSEELKNKIEQIAKHGNCDPFKLMELVSENYRMSCTT